MGLSVFYIFYARSGEAAIQSRGERFDPLSVNAFKIKSIRSIFSLV
jgi:hypothetical protein